MPTILFYFDFVSPYAYLAFHRLPQVLGGLAWRVQYRPVVLGGLFKAQGNTSPAD
ncbi:MAG: DsbA family protein, partial [Brachymonas sp.]|nr:DsbA family protein [Brachymonas sp.]